MKLQELWICDNCSFTLTYHCRFAEVVIIAVFFALVFLWLFREPPNFDGWGAAFTDPITYVCVYLWYNYNIGIQTCADPEGGKGSGPP